MVTAEEIKELEAGIFNGSFTWILKALKIMASVGFKTFSCILKPMLWRSKIENEKGLDDGI